MGFESEIVVTYTEGLLFDIESFVDLLLLEGWSLELDGKIYVQNLESKSVVLGYSLSGIVEFHNFIRRRVLEEEFVSIYMSERCFGRAISIFYSFKKKNILKISLLNEDRRHRLISPTEEINKYLKRLFAAFESQGEIEKIEFVTGHDYEVVHVLKGVELSAYSKSKKLP